MDDEARFISVALEVAPQLRSTIQHRQTVACMGRRRPSAKPTASGLSLLSKRLKLRQHRPALQAEHLRRPSEVRVPNAHLEPREGGADEGRWARFGGLG